MTDSLWPHGLQHIRPPCSTPTPRVYSNSCPLSQWCHPTISSSVIPFSCLQSFPALGSFPMSQFFTSGGQSIGVSASASVLPMNIQNWFPLLQHHSSKASVLQCAKESAYNMGAAGDMGSIPRLRGSPAEENGNPLHYSCLGHPMDREPVGLQLMAS